MSRERRRHERFVIDAPVTVATGDGEVEGQVHDLSANGAAVAFTSATVVLRLDVGDRVTLTPGDGKARTGQVVRRYDGGIGVVFDDPDD